MGWLRNLLFGKNNSKSKSSQKKKKYRGAVVVSDRSGKTGKTVVSNPSATKSEKQSRDRLNRVGSGGTRSTSSSKTVQSKPPKQPVKPKPKIPEKSNFEKFAEANKNKISTPGSIQAIGALKGSTALNAYRARMKAEEEKKKAQQSAEKEKKAKEATKRQEETVKLSTARFGSYNKSKTHLSKAAEERKEKIDKQAEKERKAGYKELKGAYEKEYDKYLKGPVSNEFREEVEKAKKGIDKAISKSAAAELKEKQRKLTLGGKLQDKKEIEKKAKAYDKKNERSQLTTDEAMKTMNMSVISANNTRANADGYNKKYYSDELREKNRANNQSGMDDGGSAFWIDFGIGDVEAQMERAYGIKLDDTRMRNSTKGKIMSAAGYLAKSAMFGGMGQDAIAKGLTKAVLKKTGKKELGKAAKFGVNRAADVVSSIPINAEDAVKNSSSLKEFGKNMAVNSALDAGLGTVLDGGAAALARKVKAKQGTKAIKILDKVKKNEPITESEIKTLKAVGLDEKGLPIQKKDLPDMTNKKEAPKTVQMSNDPHLTSKTVSVDASNNNIPGFTQQINTEPPKKYTGVRIRSNITKKEYNIPHKKELDIKKNNDGSIEVAGQPLQEVDRKDLRGFVKKYAEKNYLSRFDDKGNLIEAKPIIIESDKKQVIITKKGINDVAEKIKGGKKSVDYSESLLALDDIIEKAIKVDESPNVKGRENPYSYYESIFRTNNQPYRVYLRIKDTPNVSRYHYHTLEEMGEIEIQKIEPLDGTYTPKGDEDLLQAGSIINNSIPDSPQKINTKSEIGNKIDDAAIKTAENSEVLVDLDNDPAVRDIVAGPKNKDKSSGSLKQSLVKMKDEFRQVFVDSLQGIEVAAKKIGGKGGERLYHQANALRQAGEKANYSITTKQVDFNMQVIGKGGIEILAPIMKRGKDTYSDFNAYLFHRLNIDRFKNGKSLWGEDVISPEKSRQIISQLDDKYGDFSEAAEEVYQYFRNLNTVRVQSGMISDETKNMLEELYENYVPAYRNINKSALEKTLDGSMKVNTGIRRAKGGDQAILPIEKQMAYATQQTWKAAELNQTIKTLAEVQGHEIKEITEKILKDGDVTEGSLEELLSHSVFFDDKKTGLHKAVYYVNGKAYETKIDDIVYRGLSNWKPSDTWKMLDNDIFKTADKALTKWSNVHKALITTYNGFFALRNGVRDLGDALWYAESGTDFVKNMPGAVKSMEKRDTYWQLWKASGGKYSGLLDITQALKPESTLKKLGKLRWIEAVNEAIEQYPRFVEFKSVLSKEMKAAGITDPAKCTKEMIDKASHAGADITCNFGRVGSLTKPLNRTAVPFLNASIQGADKLWRVISGQKGARGYINLLTKLTAIGVAPGVAMEIMYANDSGFQDLNARDKDNYIFIKDDAGAFWAIPRARGASVIATPFQQLARQGLGNGEFSFDEFKQKLMNDLAPVSPFDANIFSQMINTYNNQTWYGGNIESHADAEAPKIERYNAKTTSFGKKASESMYKLLEKYGGKEAAEKYTLSPKKIDYLMDSYTGIIGDIGKSVTVMGSTKAWYHQLFDQNMKKDPVYSNHLPQDYYDKSDELNKYCNDDGSPKKGATIEQSARGQIFKNNNIALSNLRDLQNSIRMNKDMSRSEKAKYDKELQIQINNIYRNGVNEKAIKAYDDFIRKNKDSYMSNEKLIKAAQQAYEKETHATVNAMDTIYKIGGLDEVIKHSSSYEDKSGDKNKLTYSKEKTIKQILKKYRKNGGKDDDFYSVYKEMTQANKECGIGTNSAYGNLAAMTIRTSGKDGNTKENLRNAFGVSEESRQLVNEYFKLGGSKKEYLAAAEAAEATSNSLRQKSGDKYNYFAPIKARGIADKNLPDRAYRVVDSAESGRRTEYYINNSRGLKHYDISAKTLQEIDNKSAKNEKGYSTSEGLQKVLDKTKYSREEKALIWEALYGLSYKESNPYGAIGDYSLKSDVGIDTSGGYKNYGSGGYRRYGRGYRHYGRGHGSRGGSGSSTEEMTEFEKYAASLLKKTQSRQIEKATMQYKKLNTKKYSNDQYRKAIAKLLAKKIMEK